MAFGDFQPLCTNVPSYPWCNLFYRQLQRAAPTLLTGASANAPSAPVGINPVCGIPRSGYDGSIGNIPNIVLCSLSFSFVVVLSVNCYKRKAAVGRWEILAFFSLYLVSLVLQVFTTGSILEQGSTALIALTAVHVGVVISLFWALLANAIVATQIVEDGTLASMIPFSIVTLISLGVGIYISLDIALGVTTTIGGLSNPPESLKNIPLFVITSIWPLFCAVSFLVIMVVVALRVLEETKPMWYYTLAASLFIVAQLAWFLLGRVICNGTNHKMDGSWIATGLETGSVLALFLGWRSITEDSWTDNVQSQYGQ